MPSARSTAAAAASTRPALLVAVTCTRQAIAPTPVSPPPARRTRSSRSRRAARPAASCARAAASAAGGATTTVSSATERSPPVRSACAFRASPTRSRWRPASGTPARCAQPARWSAGAPTTRGSSATAAAAINSMPIPVPGVAGATAVVAGSGFSCALLADRSAVCWGDDRDGEIGDGAPGATPRAPTPVLGLAGARSLSAHWQHACAVLVDGSVVCWGSNSSGQLGDGTQVNRAQPVAVPGLQNVVSVATGLSHTCAMSAGAIRCWGDNSQGQLGSNASGASGAMAQPTLVPIVIDPVAIAAGAQHTCAVRLNGQVLCWGQNSSGQLGEGSMSSLAEPVPVAGPRQRRQGDGRRDLLLRGHERRRDLLLGRRPLRPARHRARRRPAARNDHRAQRRPGHRRRRAQLRRRTRGSAGWRRRLRLLGLRIRPASWATTATRTVRCRSPSSSRWSRAASPPARCTAARSTARPGSGAGDAARADSSAPATWSTRRSRSRSRCRAAPTRRSPSPAAAPTAACSSTRPTASAARSSASATTAMASSATAR